MKSEEVNDLLGQIAVLRQASDVDLLVFFARHPRSLVTSEQLATWLGYEASRIASSLDILLEAGLLTRTQNPTHAARLYVFAAEDISGGWLTRLLELASTRAGRRAILERLSAGRQTPHAIRAIKAG